MEEKDQKLRAGIEEIRRVKMTEGEKERLLGNILGSVSPTKKPEKSPYVIYSFVSKLHKNHLALYYGFVSCLVVLFGGGVVFASAGSLPGNILYPLKVDIIEPLYGVFMFSPEAQIQYQGRLATERLIEAEILENQGGLDREKEDKLSGLLEIHTEALNKAILDSRQEKAAGKNEKNDNGDDAVTDFQANMKAHAEILDILGRDKNPEQRNKNAKIPEQARESGDKIRKNLESKKDKDPKQYEKRKGSVESIIDSTNTKIENRSAKEASTDKLMIIDKTNRKLDQAKQSLKEAEEENKRGNLNGAYSKLLDSESSAKEAGIFLKTGLGVKKKGGDKDENDSREREGGND